LPGSNYAATQQDQIGVLRQGRVINPKGDANMNTEVFDEWVKLTKSTVEPMMKLNEITVTAMERVARQQLDVARDYLDLGTRQASVLGKAEKPEDVLAEQGQLVSEFGERLLNRAQEFARIATETQEAVANWAQAASHMATAGQAEKAKKTK
jgi:phasin family protein